MCPSAAPGPPPSGAISGECLALQGRQCTSWVTCGCGPTLPHRTCGRRFPREASQLPDYVAPPALHMPVLTLLPADIQHIHTHAYTPTGTHIAPAHGVTCILTQTHQSAHTYPCNAQSYTPCAYTHVHILTHPCAHTLTHACTDALSASIRRNQQVRELQTVLGH